MFWLEDAGHRINAEATSSKKLRLNCQCGFTVGCRICNERYWKNQHWRRILRTWE